jgi:DhnA family fructose-bisphosphate aldolase class Ia
MKANKDSDSWIDAASRVAAEIDADIIKMYLEGPSGVERHMHEWVTKPPVDPDPIKLEDEKVVVLIKTLDGDVYLGE